MFVKGRKGARMEGWEGGRGSSPQREESTMHRQEYSFPTSLSHYRNKERQMPFAVCFRDNPPLASFLRAAVLETLK